MNPRALRRALLLALLAAGCGATNGDTGGVIQAQGDNVVDPQALSAEKSRISGAYAATGGAAVGDFTALTLRIDRTFDRELCGPGGCGAPLLESGTYTLEQSRATRVWTLTFAPLAHDPDAGAPSPDSFLYQLSGETMQLERIGSPGNFQMKRIDDRDAAVSSSLEGEETARLAGVYALGGAAAVGDLSQLTLRVDRSYRFTRCAEASCQQAQPELGSFRVTESSDAQTLYLSFSASAQGAGAAGGDGGTPGAAPVARYAYLLDGGTLRMREVGSARWFVMQR